SPQSCNSPNFCAPSSACTNGAAGGVCGTPDFSCCKPPASTPPSLPPEPCGYEDQACCGQGYPNGTCQSANMYCSNLDGGTCMSKTCNLGDRQCDDTLLKICNADGSNWNYTPCPHGCNSNLNQCQTCTPGSHQCSGNALKTCNSGGTGWGDSQACPVNFTCDAALGQCNPNNICSDSCSTDADCGDVNQYYCYKPATGCPECKPRATLCSPGSKQCSGNFVQICNQYGTSWLSPQECSNNTTCESGVCKPNVVSQADYDACLQENTPAECANLLDHLGDTYSNTECDPNQNQPFCSGTSIKSCSSSGTWGLTTCPGGCDPDTVTCLTSRCGSGNSSLETYQNGQWSSQMCVSYCDSQTLTCVDNTRPDTLPPDLANINPADDPLSLTQDPLVAATLNQAFIDCVTAFSQTQCTQAFQAAANTGDTCVASYMLVNPLADISQVINRCDTERGYIPTAAFIASLAAASITAAAALPEAALAAYSYATATLATTPWLQTALAIATLSPGPAAIIACEVYGQNSEECFYAGMGITSGYYSDVIGSEEALQGSAQLLLNRILPPKPASVIRDYLLSRPPPNYNTMLYQRTEVIEQPWFNSRPFASTSDTRMAAAVAQIRNSLGDPTEWAGGLGMDDIAMAVYNRNLPIYNQPNSNPWANNTQLHDLIIQLGESSEVNPLYGRALLGDFFGTTPRCVGNICYQNAILAEAVGATYDQTSFVASFYDSAFPDNAGHAAVLYFDETGNMLIADPTNHGWSGTIEQYIQYLQSPSVGFNQPALRRTQRIFVPAVNQP
ncbi:MAG: hypothetical protein V1810_05260, partial [Candidatus Beckwithbacteria bacterium]